MFIEGCDGCPCVLPESFLGFGEDIEYVYQSFLYACGQRFLLAQALFLLGLASLFLSFQALFLLCLAACLLLSSLTLTPGRHLAGLDLVERTRGRGVL